MTLLLAGDIGGTKTLLSLYRCSGSQASGLQSIGSQRYASADWEDLAAMVRHFLAASADLLRGGKPEAACFAVAGPVQGGRAQLTNLDWNLGAAELAEDLAIPRLELVNDFAVLLYGLPHLEPHQQAPVRDGMVEAGAPLLILGAGTGLGVAIGIPTESGLIAVASEAAHGSFAPRTPQEWELLEWLRQDLAIERVSIERVVSGTGLGHVARWLLQRRPAGEDHPLSSLAREWVEGPEQDDPAAGEQGAMGTAVRPDLPAAVAAAAARGDGLAAAALDLWLGAYGAVTGDLALTCLSRGGVWLAGGTAAKQLQALRSDRFEAAFLAKGRLRSVLEPMPIGAVIDPAIGSFSAACRARMLLA
jgi:glucokinase